MKSPVYALWDALAEAGKSLADGLTLAAEILCPRDHTAEDRLRVWETAAVAVEGEICDEADSLEAADEPECEFHGQWCAGETAWCNRRCSKCDQAVYWHRDAEAWFHEYGLADRPPCPYGDGPVVEHSSAAVSAAADPSPADVQAAGDEGPEGASAIPPAAPSGQPTDPGAVSTPAPGGQDEAECEFHGEWCAGERAWCADYRKTSAAVESELKLRVCTWCDGPYFKCKGQHPGSPEQVWGDFKEALAQVVGVYLDGFDDAVAAALQDLINQLGLGSRFAVVALPEPCAKDEDAQVFFGDWDIRADCSGSLAYRMITTDFGLGSEVKQSMPPARAEWWARHLLAAAAEVSK